MTYSGHPKEHWQELAEKLKAAGHDRFTVQRVQQILGYKSTSAAQNALYKMEALGLIEHTPHNTGSWSLPK